LTPLAACKTHGGNQRGVVDDPAASATGEVARYCLPAAASETRYISRGLREASTAIGQLPLGSSDGAGGAIDRPAVLAQVPSCQLTRTGGLLPYR
jgi:hypothetical protein